MVAGRFGLAAILLLASAVAPAIADGMCAGTVTGSVLQALPKPGTVSVAQPVSDVANPALAQEFLNGMQAAGLTVAAPGQSNIQIDATFTVTAPAGATNATYKGFGWMSGTQMPSGGGTALPGTALSVSIEATNLGNQTLAWVGTINCTVRTNDPSALAADLGRGVARALGRSIQQQPF